MRISSLFWQRLLTFCLCLALAGIIGYWATVLLAPKQAIAPAPISNASVVSSSAHSLRLFGGAEASPAAAADNRITVLGVITGSNAAAVIAEEGKTPRPMAVGEYLGPATKLVEIRRDAVAFDRDGKRFEVPAPATADLSILSAGPAAAKPSSPPTPGAAQAPVAPAPAIAPVQNPPPPPAPQAPPPLMPGGGAPGMPPPLTPGVRGSNIPAPATGTNGGPVNGSNSGQNSGPNPQ